MSEAGPESGGGIGNWLWLGGLTAAAVLVVVVFVPRIGVSSLSEPPDCESYEFDRDAWDRNGGADREYEAAALDYCDALIGMTLDEVRAMLDISPKVKPDRNRKISVLAGTVNDYLGPGDDQRLRIEFDRQARVKSTFLPYPPAWDE